MANVKLPKLNKEADKILRHIVKMCKEQGEGNFIKIDNSSYMPVWAEIVHTTKFFDEKAEIFSLSHYGEMNGDLMADPTMDFLIVENAIYPMSFRNDYAYFSGATHRQSLDLTTMSANKAMMKDQADFASIWLKNIKEQQGLKI
ncbi:hypothetical protein OFO01_07270 [Campylobacter sp. JMF_01 NE2]|uniref:DUF6908 domain-containing protein n=1 Tax=unclassified Campylobacter TaxID=2593542 RepID=UPI0022E9C32D|nr:MULTISPECIES: hypothetical protein [unclassified Campylobacter]MDA3053236.1 hypothetical protein [Campylobacter sp. JMF_03 NE3]MDA3067581.1 hypothetical protein [Campylobacter sp. JMF_01 NE2]